MDSAKNLAALERHYEENPIVLYTGAGVSQTKCKYGMKGWWELLKLIYIRGAKGKKRTFDKEWNELSDTWEIADWIVENCPGDNSKTKVAKFQRTLVGIVRGKRNYTKGHRQLSGNFLSNAHTLNAITAFCCRLRGRVTADKKIKARDVRFAIDINPRVKAVLTSNYDPFLETASTTKFIRRRLKPVAAKGSLAGEVGAIPVFHPHGYVAHRYQKKKGAHVPLIKNLVLTRAEYEQAWNPRDVYGTTMAHQIHYLRHYITLFIGFSFTDKYICELLADLKEEFAKSRAARDRSHYAILTERCFLDAGGRIPFDVMGVKPIFCKDDHSDIPDILGSLYISGLEGEAGGKVSLPWVTPKTHKPTGRPSVITTGKYWNALLACRNSAMPRKKYMQGSWKRLSTK